MKNRIGQKNFLLYIILILSTSLLGQRQSKKKEDGNQRKIDWEILNNEPSLEPKFTGGLSLGVFIETPLDDGDLSLNFMASGNYVFNPVWELDARLISPIKSDLSASERILDFQAMAHRSIFKFPSLSNKRLRLVIESNNAGGWDNYYSEIRIREINSIDLDFGLGNFRVPSTMRANISNDSNPDSLYYARAGEVRYTNLNLGLSYSNKSLLKYRVQNKTYHRVRNYRIYGYVGYALGARVNYYYGDRIELSQDQEDRAVDVDRLAVRLGMEVKYTSALRDLNLLILSHIRLEFGQLPHLESTNSNANTPKSFLMLNCGLRLGKIPNP